MTNNSVRKDEISRRIEELTRKFEDLWGMPLALRLERNTEKAAQNYAANADPMSVALTSATFVDIRMEADGKKCVAELREIYVPDGCYMAVRLEWALSGEAVGGTPVMGLTAIGEFLAGYEPEEDAETAGYRRVAEFLEGFAPAGEEA